MLQNPIFIGRIRRRKLVHPGQHPPIIDEAIWQAVQDQLAAHRRERSVRPTAHATSPLAGKLFDPDGKKMRPSHANKKGRRFRYYVSEGLIDGSVAAGASGWRIPAGEMEATVANAVAARLREPQFVGEALRSAEVGAEASDKIVTAISWTADRLEGSASAHALEALRLLITRVDLSQSQLRAEASFARLDEAASGGAADGALRALPPFTVAAPLRLQRRGAELRLVLGGAAAPASRADPVLLRTLIEARKRVAAYLDPTQSVPVSDLADQEGVHVGDVSRSLQLALLAPDLVEAILDETQPLALTAERLKRIGELPLLWEEQRALLA